MFTGLIESIGSVTAVERNDASKSGGGGFSLTVGGAGTADVLVDCHMGDSIAINGTCLTVTAFDAASFKVGISPETLRKTNLGSLEVGSRVNLERAMSAATRFGGHFVQGHVDTTATIKNVRPDGNALWFDFTLDAKDARFMSLIIPKGYVAIDGTSLTVTETRPSERGFSIMLIAYSQEKVILAQKKPGATVNIEVDMLGKYVERVVEGALTTAAGSTDHSSRVPDVKDAATNLLETETVEETPLVKAIRSICETVVKERLDALLPAIKLP